MHNKTKLLIGLILLLLVAISQIWAGELDLLVQELVAKGIIDPGRAQEILTLTEEEMRKELAKGQVATLPSWIQKLGIKGDFRFRNQWEKFDGDSLARTRQRIRFRLSGEADIAQGFKVGFGLASGGTDPRSTNQTLENSFETKTIMLDYAYGEYNFPRYVTILGGKFYNDRAIWAPTDYMWDTDITLEGIAGLVKTKRFFINSGLYVLDEMGKVKNVIKDNPRLFVLQPGIALAREGLYRFKTALTYYNFNKTRNMSFDHAKWSNSYYKVGSTKYLANGYNNLSVAVDAGIFDKIFPYIGIFGEYNTNVQAKADTANKGMALGAVVGSVKVSDRGNWQVKYQYRKLEKDAWLDFLPDSDTYSGKTDIKGHELILQYCLTKNVVIGLDYYIIENLRGTIVPETLWQMDIQFKF